jgi:hypothetical protein
MNRVFLGLCCCLGLLSEFAFAQELVLAELFTYDGCAHCNLANRALRNIEHDTAFKNSVVFLTYHVDYDSHDDYLDSLYHPFSRQRQKELVDKGICNGLFTPQIVLGGKMCNPFSTRAQFLQMVNAYRVDSIDLAVKSTVSRIDGGFSVLVEFTDGLPSDWFINLVLVQNERVVSPQSGDNTGSTLRHRNCMLEAIRFEGRMLFEESFKMPQSVLKNPEQYAAVFFLQHKQSGAVQNPQAFPLHQIR